MFTPGINMRLRYQHPDLINIQSRSSIRKVYVRYVIGTGDAFAFTIALNVFAMGPQPRLEVA